jgi:hypothetical protein
MEQNISSLNELLSFWENPVYKIAEGLRKEGYEVAGHMGVKVPEQKQPPCNMVGILKERDPIQKSFFGIKYNKSRRAFHLGTIWINNEEKGAIEDEKWILEVCGEKYKSKLTELVEKIALPYNVQVETILSRKTPMRETYLSDLHR